MQSQIEKEADLPVSQQSVLFKGKSLDSGATLTDAGVADGDAESKTDKKTAEFVQFESIDDLYGFMEFGDGSANWS